jgi:hypothetical protein
MPSASACAASSTFESDWLSPGGEPLELRVDDLLELPDVGPHLLEHRPHNATVFLQQRRKQMHRLNLRIPSLGSQFLRKGHGFLSLDC